MTDKPHLDEEALAARAIAILEQHGEELAGLIVEPLVQGAAGMRMHSPAFLEPVLKRAARIADGPDEVHRIVVARDFLLGRMDLLV